MRRRIFIIVLLAIIIVAAGAVFTVFHRLNGIVTQEIDRYGSQMAGTAVAADGVKVALRQGRITIGSLRVGNPEGFSHRDALVLRDLTIQLDLQSLRGHPYILQRVEADSARALYEVDAHGRRNLDVIGQNVRTYSAAHQPDEPRPPPRLTIQRLRFGGGHVEVDATALGLARREVPLPALAMQDLGGTAGEPADAIGKQVLERLVRQAAEAAASNELQRLLEQKVGSGALEKAKGALEKLVK